MSSQMPEVQSLESIPGLFAPQREFCIHNAGDAPIELGYDGETFTIPAVNEVVKPHPKYADAFCSGKDSQGNYIPGTLVVRDKIEDRNANADLEGNRARGDRWDAAAAVRHCLGVDPKSKKPTSKWYSKGISLLPIGATPDVVKAATKDGRARFELFRLANDRELVNSILAKTAKEKQLGLMPMPLTQEIEQAQARLLAAAQKGINVPELEKAPPALDKGAMVEALLEDGEFLALLKEKLSVKKGK